MSTEPIPHGGLTPQETELLLAIGDGDAALLLMYTRHNSLAWPENMPGFSNERLDAARTLLRDAGLLSRRCSEDTTAPPAYPAAEIASGSLTDPAFAAVVRETEGLLRKTLSSQDLQTLFGIYDWRGLPPGVLYLLVHHCLAEADRRYGAGIRPPSLRQIDREAAIWVEKGLFTEAAAERYIQEQEAAQQQESRVFRAIGVFPRQPSPTEKKFVARWMELGFDHETIALAYDKTVTATGKMAWPYCDKILSRWHEAGLHTLAEVQSQSQRQRSAAPAAPAAGRAAPESPRGGLDRAREILQRVKEQ